MFNFHSVYIFMSLDNLSAVKFYAPAMLALLNTILRSIYPNQIILVRETSFSQPPILLR